MKKTELLADVADKLDFGTDRPKINIINLRLRSSSIQVS